MARTGAAGTELKRGRDLVHGRHRRTRKRQRSRRSLPCSSVSSVDQDLRTKTRSWSVVVRISQITEEKASDFGAAHDPSPAPPGRIRVCGKRGGGARHTRRTRGYPLSILRV